MRNNKAFTLVELLTIIVILAIILSIAIPSITSIISSSSKVSFESDAKMVLKGIYYKQLEDPSFDVNTLDESSIADLLNMPNSNYATLVVSIVDGVRTVTITGKDKWEGLVACGSYMGMKVVTSENVAECSNI